MINTVQIELQTSGHCDVKDVTLALQQALGTTGPQKGQALVFVAGSIAGVTTVEFEPGLVKDLNEFFQNIIRVQQIKLNTYCPSRSIFFLQFFHMRIKTCKLKTRLTCKMHISFQFSTNSSQFINCVSA